MHSRKNCYDKQTRGGIFLHHFPDALFSWSGRMFVSPAGKLTCFDAEQPNSV